MSTVQVSQDPTDTVVIQQELDDVTIAVGQMGPPGLQGPPSTVPGPEGPAGVDGNTVLYGTIDPTPGIGANGDFYINTTTHFIFGPMAGGAWPAGTSLIGPQGPQGIQGVQGPQGVAGPQGIQGIPGNTVLYGAGAPASGTGVNGNFYIDTTADFIYGPKASGAWPAGTSLIGPQGPQGAAGGVGPVGPAGPTITPCSGRLVCVSATSIQFVPYNGADLKINGVIYQIPAAGITAANTGVYVNGVAGQNLAANALYYVYLFNNAGVLTIDFVTTPHVTCTVAGNVGVEIKSGDVTRTLIGMVYTTNGGAFNLPSPNAIIGVLSWFNRRALPITIAGSNVSTTVTTTINLGAGPVIGMLNWGDESIHAVIVGAVNNTVNWGQLGVGIDQGNGSAANLIGIGAIFYSAGTGVSPPGAGGGWAMPTEGLHLYWVALGANSGGTSQALNNTISAMTKG